MVYRFSQEEELQGLLEQEVSKLKSEGKEVDIEELTKVIQDRLKAEMEERAQWDWWYAPQA